MEVLFFTSLLILSILSLFILGYLIIRTNFVYGVRMKVLKESLDKYNLLLSYDDMLLKKFWVWDINKLYDTEKIKNKRINK